jgi:hypothetical protein
VRRPGNQLFTEHSARALTIRLVAWAEQEIRAYPKLYNAFYTAVTHNAPLRNLAGRVKERLRASYSAYEGSRVLPTEEPQVAERRAQAVAARLGIDGLP